MRRHARASSAGSILGTGKSRARFGGVFATRGGSGDGDGSGALAAGGLLAVVSLVALLAALLLAPAAQAGKALGFGVLGTGTTGAGAGQLNAPKGIAVNATGAGGATAGDVYVADTTNRRISVFSATGAFVRAFGRDVVATGPDNSANNEVQKVTVKASGGKFALKFGTATTGLLDYNVPASGGVGATASVQNALEALSTIGAGNVAVTGGPGNATGSTPYVVTFQGAQAGKNVAAMTINSNTLAIAVGSQLTCTGSRSGGNGTQGTGFEYQWLADGASLGSANGAQTATYTVQPGDAGKTLQCRVIAQQKVSIGGALFAAIQVQPPVLTAQTVADPFPATAPPTTTQTALAAPTGTVAAGNKIKCAPGTWTGSPTFSYQWYRNGVELVGNGANTIEYTVQPADTGSISVFQCAAKATNAGGSPVLFSQNLDFGIGFGTGSGAAAASVPVSTVETAPEGGGVESCLPAVDTCQAGEAGALAGVILSPSGLAIDQANGNVFVATTNSRIDVFSATGKFQGAIGWGVKLNGTAPELQLCTLATECKAGEAGSAAGQMGALTNVTGPAIDPNNGHLYVSDPNNLRIDEFAPTLNGSKEVTGVSFVRAFGGDVVPTINEKQTVTLSGASGGTFKLSFGGKSTGAAGIGDTEAGSNEITDFTASSGTFLAGEAISGPGIPAGVKVTAVTFDSLTISAAATETAEGVSLAANLPFDASAAVVQSAFNLLSTVGSGGSAVSGSPGGPWTVEFTGSLAGKDVAPLTVDASGLTGASPAAVVATTQTGTNGTGRGLEVCTAATTCKAGIASTATGLEAKDKVFASADPDGLAVDSEGGIFALAMPSTGATTCEVAAGNCAILKFNSGATSITNFAPEYLQGVAGTANANAPTDVSIDPVNGHPIVAKRVGTNLVKFFEFSKAGQFLESYPPSGITNTTTNMLTHGMAAGTGERLYYNDAGASKVRILAPPPAPTVTIDTPGAVSATTVAVSGTVTLPAPGPDGGYETLYQFEYSRDGIKWTAASDPISVGNGSGAGNPNSCPTGNPPSCNVTQTITGLEPGANYLVRLMASDGTKATTGTQVFTTTAALPKIGAGRPNPVEKTTATLIAYLNPNNQPTTYHFEWGTDESYGARIPTDFDAVAGSGGAPVKVTANLTGLSPNTTYHYRLVANNGSGAANGSDRTLHTLNAAGLPDNRGFEMVSPAEKRPTATAVPVLGGRYKAAEDGHGFTYPLLNGLSDSSAGGEVQYASTRTPSQWLAAQVSGPTLIPTPTGDGMDFAAEPSYVRYVEPNMGCAVVSSFSPLTADTPEVDAEFGVSNLYRWNPADGTYTLLTNRVPLNPDNIEPGYLVRGASSDCSRVFFTSTKFTFLAGASGLYEWDEGTLRDAGLRPDSSPATSIDSIAGNLYRVARNGNLFFVGTSNQGADATKAAVFVRKGPGQVIDASQPVTATAPLGAQFLAASPDGSHVFFAANYGLTPLSSPGPAELCTKIGGPGVPGMAGGNLPCAIYDYDVDTGTLKDLTASANPANTNGAVAQGILDVSEDGSVVYFAAKGQLVAAKGRTYAQNQQGVGYANVYRSEGGALQYVGSISTTDMNTAGGSFNAGGALIQSIKDWTAQTTKSGDYLLYVSTANGSTEPQAYLYSEKSGESECVSCPAEGAPAVADPNFLFGFSNPNTDTFTSGARLLSEDGRVFFTANDALTPGSTVKDEKFSLSPAAENNIYEWHEGQVALLASGRVTLFDVGGLNGEDVFIRSFEQLAPQDIDFAADIYDIKAGGGFAAPPEPPTPCDPAADQCQGTPSSPPAASGNQPSSEFNGSGNPAPEKEKPVKCPKGKVRKHGKCVSKHHKQKHKKKQHSHGRAANANRGGSK